MRSVLLSSLLVLLVAMPLSAAEPAVRSNMLVSADWLSKNLAKPGLVVLQIGRDRKAYDAGHLPGARFVGMNELVVERAGIPNELPPLDVLVGLVRRLGIDGKSRVVLYDDMDGLLAARAYVTLDYLGLGDGAALLDGGLVKWKKDGRKLSAESPAAPPASDFVPRLRPEIIVEMRPMRDLSAAKLAGSPVTLVDARPPEEYSGQKAGDGVLRGGHIPGATSVFWKQNLVSTDNPVMKPAAELRKLYAGAGATPKGMVVTYCRTGVQSSHAYFTAKYLGYDVRMYDGSFLEWSRTDAPVETK